MAQHKLSKHGKLPPVLPVVLYHGRSAWRAPTALASLMLPPPAGLERFQPSQQYLLLDQHHGTARADVVSLLFRLLDAVRGSLTRWIQFTLRDAAVETSMDLEEAFTMKMRRKFSYDEMFDPGMFERPIAKAREKAIVEGLQQGREEGLQQGLQEGMQQGMRQGLQKGMQQGMVQGRNEGLCEGQRLALRRLIGRLLGDAMPTEVASRVAAADVEQLNRWIEALFNGASPGQLFAEG